MALDALSPHTYTLVYFDFVSFCSHNISFIIFVFPEDLEAPCFGSSSLTHATPLFPAFRVHVENLSRSFLRDRFFCRELSLGF